MKKLLPLLFIAVLLSAFKPSVTSGPINSPKVTDTINLVNAGKVWASLYQQRAAEYKALCFQAYNIAKERIDAAVKKHGKKPFAVITDIDETLLDNSPLDAGRALHNLNYDSKAWKQWTAKGIADSVPGAPTFLKYAASKGVKIFYISNREADERAGTLKNLQLYHLPNADSLHLLLKKEPSSSKESRRQKVLKKYNIILFCGDNLPDFDAIYDNNPTETDRTAATQKLRKEFGNCYIVIPNPTYGDFEGALFMFNFKLTPAQKDSIIRSLIKLDK
jgi:5'-nucleotidase (lipoprotein e(P4) family)